MLFRSGVTLGLHDVNYHSDSYYTENFVAEKEAYGESRESLKISGLVDFGSSTVSSTSALLSTVFNVFAFSLAPL